jgi:hypothetical protein
MFPPLYQCKKKDTLSVCGFDTSRTSSGIYMQEALKIICCNQKLNPNDYALLLDKGKDNRLIPLDRAVHLGGTSDLVLVKRSTLPQLGVMNVGKTTDPNGDWLFEGEVYCVFSSIDFQQISDVLEVRHSSPTDITAGYKVSLPPLFSSSRRV